MNTLEFNPASQKQLSNAQMLLLNFFAEDVPEDDLLEIKKVFTAYRLRRAATTQLITAELLLEAAVSLYATHKLSFGQAQRLSGLDWFSFRSILHERRIPAHYEPQDLATDLENLQHLHHA